MKGISYTFEKVPMSDEKSPKLYPGTDKRENLGTIFARIRTSSGRAKIKTGITIPRAWWERGSITAPRRGQRDYQQHKDAARALATFAERLERVAGIVGIDDADQLRRAVEVTATMQADDITASTLATLMTATSSESVASALRDYIASGTSLRNAIARQPISESVRRRVASIASAWQRWDSSHRQPVTLASITRDDVATFLAWYAAQPASGRGRRPASGSNRSGNTLAVTASTLRTALTWCSNRHGITLAPDLFQDKPREQYSTATPYYLTSDEVAAVAGVAVDTPTKRAFLFACMTGVRFGDLATLTADNVEGDTLVYTSHKTATATSVPLSPSTLQLIAGRRAGQRLFNLPTAATYNAQIRQLLRAAGITRNVTTSSGRQPLCDVASSHLARRTFVGRLVDAGVTAEVIQSMSGHARGSHAFARYYNVSSDAQRQALTKL